jgi:hypothetical protein
MANKQLLQSTRGAFGPAALNTNRLDAEFIAKTAVYAGSDPSLADIVRMVHPKPNDPVREAFYGWLLGKPYAVEALPRRLRDFIAYKLADVPCQERAFDVVNEFAAGELSPEQWIEKIEEVVI